MANLLPETVQGEIDRQLLRDKWSGRMNLFFNETNSGGGRAARTELGWTPPALELDPAVRYRTVRGRAAIDEFINTGVMRGAYIEHADVPAGLFFNQGQPLWSYAGLPSQSDERYLIATLGEDWGTRKGYTPRPPDSLETMQGRGGIRLTDYDKERVNTTASRLFPYTQEGLVHYGLHQDVFNSVRNRLLSETSTYARMGSDGTLLAGRQHGEPLTLEGKTAVGDFLRMVKKSVQTANGFGIDPKDFKYILDYQSSSGRKHPLVTHRDELNHKLTVALDSALQRKAGLLRLEKNADGTFKETQQLAKEILGLDLPDDWEKSPVVTLKALEKVIPEIGIGTAWESLRGIDSYLRDFYEPDNLKKVGYTQRPQERLDIASQRPSTGLTLTDASPVQPLSVYVDEKGQPISDQGKVLSNLHTYIQPELNPNPVSLGPSDDYIFRTPYGVSENLVKALKEPIYSQGEYMGTTEWTPFDKLRVDKMGIEGAMYSEALPIAKIPAIGYGIPSLLGGENPTSYELRRWQTPAVALNANTSNRPFAIFRIDPNSPNGIELVHEVNNDVLPEGYKPIPTGMMRPNAMPEATQRFIEETKENPISQENVYLGVGPQELVANVIKSGNTAIEQDYLRIGSLIEESTKGHPNYGRKGFVDIPSLTKPLSNVARSLVAKDPFLGAVEYGMQDPARLQQMLKTYSTPTGRKLIQAELGASGLRTLGKLGTAGAIAMSPFDAISRKNAYDKYLVDNGATYEQLESMRLPVAVASGLETAANFGTFGLYDAFSPSVSAESHRKAAEADFFRGLAQRQYLQQGIDYPVMSTDLEGNQTRFTRTTK